MLSEKKRRAVDLLFEHTEGEVAKKLKVSLETLAQWIEEMEFREALNFQMKGYQRTTSRMLALLYLECCRELRAIIHDKEDKNRHRVAVDLLKAGGVLKEGELSEVGYDPIEALIESLSEEDGKPEKKEWQKAEEEGTESEQ